MMGNELLKIADGFSMVADGLRGLAGMEWNGAVDMAEKDAAVPGSAGAVDTDGMPGRGRRPGKRIRRMRVPGRRRLSPLRTCGR